MSCLSTFDLSGDGVEEVVVGRDDGVVEVYSMDEASQPRLKFTHVSCSLSLYHTTLVWNYVVCVCLVRV